MDHQAVCDCPFKGQCATYRDRLIPAAQKDADGLGCEGQNDLYRSEHCRTFACKYLASVLGDMIGAESHPVGPGR